MTDRDQPETNLAITALILALCSLVVTTGQLLGQYFATADGYRRCQPSVMGPWAERTRLRWRWRQFRFEILFTTPDIYLDAFLHPGGKGFGYRMPEDEQVPGSPPLKYAPHLITGSSQSEVRTMVPVRTPAKTSDEHVCWLPFLASLHWHEHWLSQHGGYDEPHGRSPMETRLRVGPALTFRERSWDFMVPDMVRPHATTNISDLAVLARRLGMTWTDFRPEDGVLRAEGNGHLLTSTMARSVGIVVQYLHAGPQKQSAIVVWMERAAAEMTDRMREELYVPVREADALGFGVLMGCRRLHVPDFRIGTIEEVLATMDSLDPSGQASKTIQDVRRLSPRVTFGFSDIIPMAAPMVRFRGIAVIRVPIPSEYSVGLTCHTEGFVVFHHRLREYRKDHGDRWSAAMDWVLRQYEALKASDAMWEDEVKANERANGRATAFLDRVHGCWDETTRYFLEREDGDGQGAATARPPSSSNNHHPSSTTTTTATSSLSASTGPSVRYMDLLTSHLIHAVNYWGDAWARIRGDDPDRPARDHYGLRNWIAEGMHCYFDYLPAIVRDMRQRSGIQYPEEVIHEAWFMLIFRAFCWWRCHWMMHGRDMVLPAPPTVPSRYWESRLPVYIG